MSETKHTPGPWYAEPVINGKEHWIISHGENGSSNIPATYANALLINAAPATAAERDRLKAINADLLEALRNLAERAEDVSENIDPRKRYEGVTILQHVCHMAAHLAEHAKIARAAIAKAES